MSPPAPDGQLVLYLSVHMKQTRANHGMHYPTCRELVRSMAWSFSLTGRELRLMQINFSEADDECRLFLSSPCCGGVALQVPTPTPAPTPVPAPAPAPEGTSSLVVTLDLLGGGLAAPLADAQGTAVVQAVGLALQPIPGVSGLQFLGSQVGARGMEGRQGGGVPRMAGRIVYHEVCSAPLHGVHTSACGREHLAAKPVAGITCLSVANVAQQTCCHPGLWLQWS